MLSCFENGVFEYGLPTRIRSDLGGENVEVWRYMVREHSNDASCVIVGSSTHNERIERLWRDVHRCVLKPFGNHFRHLEEIGFLDPLNEIDIFCLHTCYLPRIDKCIRSFQEAWNNHRLSTEGNATPFQLFLSGSLISNEAPVTPSHHVSSVLPAVGEHVTVPRSHFNPCSALQHALKTRFDPLSSPNCFDDGLYVSVVTFTADLVCVFCSLNNEQ